MFRGEATEDNRLEDGSIVSVERAAVEEEGVLFPPPSKSTSSPITLVTHMSGLFVFPKSASPSPPPALLPVIGGLFGKE